MNKLHHLGAFYADILPLDKRLVKSTTSADLAVNETTPLLLVYAQSITEVTKAFMGLATKDLKNTTA
jgi:hypothetical protein